MAERVSASQKLGKKDAQALLGMVTKVVAAKRAKVETFATGGKADAAAVAALLGPTGNLRAPTIRVGKTLLVGFDEAAFREALN